MFHPWSTPARRRATASSAQHRRRSFDHLEARLAPASTQFAVIGDYGSAGTTEAAVAALVSSWNPDVIITTGDNNYPSGAASTIDANIGQYYHQYIGNYVGTYGPGSPVNRFFPSLGNHDWQTRSGTPPLPTPYLNYFTLPGNERYYTFTQGPVQFFAIDSGDGTGGGADGFDPDGYTSTSVQGQWLQAQLAASTAQWKIVYMHHAAYSSSSNHGSTPVMQWPYQAWGATAVITGHDHHYERLEVGGLPYFVNGAGGHPSLYAFNPTPVAGSQVRYNANHGAMRVNADDTSIQFQFITRTGVLIDSYTMQTTGPVSTVTVAATDATAAEPGSNTGTFTVTRTGSTAADLVVNLIVSGTATGGQDYAAVGTTVTIPAGAAAVTVPITPINDTVSESSETVTLQVGPSGVYNVGAANTATVTILDDDGSIVTLVPTGSVWKYLDNGSNQGTAWRAAGFDDGGWAAGSAELGYGDGDEATVVSFGPNASSKYITTYFRRAFTVADAAAVIALNLRLVRDDGAVVYLNGTEVFRSNMPSGTVTFTTLASSGIGGAAESTFVQAAIARTGLVSGTNVLAVEIHQSAANSTDISFNLELSATTALPPTVAAVQVNDGTAQRSQVRSLTVTFSNQVTITGSPFVLTRIGGGPVGLVMGAPVLDGIGRTVVTLTFAGAAEIDPTSLLNGGPPSLADGRYRLSITDGSITSTATGQVLDGDGNGTSGGAYQSPTDTAGGGPGQLGLYRLFGDATGNGVVDLSDLAAFRSTFNADAGNPTYLDYLDADNSGTVDLADLQEFRGRFNVSLF